MRKIILFVFGFLLTLPMVAQAQQATHATPPTTATGINASDVQRAEDYLRGLGTVQASFVQRADNGSRLTGTFYLNRPGKLRFEYNEVDDFIVADGFFIYFYDSELKEQTNAPIGQTLADFLLRKDLSLSGDLIVNNVEQNAQYKIITLVSKDDQGSGAVKLFFEKQPYALKKWHVIDAAGLTTEITLSNMQRNIKLPASLFAYIAPKGDKPTYNE